VKRRAAQLTASALLPKNQEQLVLFLLTGLIKGRELRFFGVCNWVAWVCLALQLVHAIGVHVPASPVLSFPCWGQFNHEAWCSVYHALFVFQCGLSVTTQIVSKRVATGESIIPILAVCTYSNTCMLIFLTGWKNLLVYEVLFKRVAASHDSSGLE